MSTSRHTVPLPRRALAIAIVLALLAPAAALAQDDFSLEEAAPVEVDENALAELTTIYSHVEFGLGFLNDDSFRFGRFRGLDSDGVFGVFNLDWYKRAPYDSADPTYTRLTVNDLGLDSRTARFEHGRQGDYRVRVDYAQLPMLRSDSGSTIFNGAGGTLLTLPPGWVPRTNTSGMTALLPSLQPIELRHDRRRIGLRLACAGRASRLQEEVSHEHFPPYRPAAAPGPGHRHRARVAGAGRRIRPGRLQPRGSRAGRGGCRGARRPHHDLQPRRVRAGLPRRRLVPLRPLDRPA
jgi:hypothetical protein